MEDDYLEMILGKQINDVIYPEIDKMWPGAYVNIKQMHIKDSCLDINMHSLKDFLDSYENPPYADVDLFIPRSVSDKWSIEEEYKFWSEDIGQMILQHNIPKISLGVWVVDDDRMSEVNEFYRTTERRITFVENKFGKMTYHFNYDELTMKMISYEDYKKRRIGN